MDKLKSFLFSTAALLLPLALLGVVELGLRLADVDAERHHPFVPIDGHPEFLAFNPAYPARYFRSFSPSVSFEPFERQKSASTFRIVALGGSSTAGFPYAQYNAFPAQLRSKLDRRLLGRRVEVLNLGMTAVNSFTLWDLAQHVAGIAPDAIVIYAGHNEFYGAFGVGSSEYGIGRIVWPKRLILALKDFVFFRMLDPG